MDRLRYIQRIVAAAAPRVTRWLYGCVGQQFFLDDASIGDSTEPLMVRNPPDGPPHRSFLSRDHVNMWMDVL